MQLGVVLDILWPLERIERLALTADAAGFDQVWVSDHPLGHDPFLVLLHLVPITVDVPLLVVVTTRPPRGGPSEELLRELGTITMDCEFCNQRYRFGRGDLAEILGGEPARTWH